MELRKAKSIAKRLMKEYGIDYELCFDNAKVRFGYCNITKKKISLSKKLVRLNTEEIVTSTIIHEIAHAIAYEKHGSRGHDANWKSVARSMGHTANRCYGEEVVMPKMKYNLTCPNCTKIVGRQRIGRKIACGDCCRKYNGGIYSTDYVYEVSKNW